MDVMRASANKIRKWWHDRRAFDDTWDIMREMLYAKRRVQEEYELKHAVLLQRNIRRWLRWRHGMYLVKRMVLSMQSRYRTWAPKESVEMMRINVGPHVNRLPSQLVALTKDKHGKLTRYRAFRSKERACPHTARIVRCKVLPPAFRSDLVHVVATISSFMRHRLRMKRMKACLRLVRGWLVRRNLRKRRLAAVMIQRNSRNKLCKRAADGKPLVQRIVLNVTIVQAFTRGFLARSKTKELRQEKKDLAAKEKTEEPLEGTPQ